MDQRKTNVLYVTAIIGIFMLGWIMQSRLLLNWDVSWLIHATRRLMAGGTYIKDFPDINPPMILYLTIPVILLSKFLSITTIVAMRLYIFLMASVSLCMCYSLIKNIFSQKDRGRGYLFLIILAVIFLILPIYEFGQREHVMVILIMPYLLAATYRLQGGKINLWFAIVIGLLAGAGFCIKPFFLATFALIELYSILYKRQFFAWIRPEVVIILSLLAAYAISTVLLQPDYFKIIIPLALRFYYIAVHYSWDKLILHPILLFSYSMIIFSAIQYHENQYKVLNNILVLTLIGFMIAYFMQQTTWYYHLLPVFALSILTGTLSIDSLLPQNTLNKQGYVFSIALGTMIFAYPFYFVSYNYLNSIIYKNNMGNLITDMRSFAKHQKVYFLTTTPSMEFPAVDYAESIPASRCASHIWIAGIIKPTNNKSLENQRNKDKNYFVDMIADELNTNKPKFVFVDTNPHKFYLDNIDFNYLAYFSQNQHFKQAWKAYAPFKIIELNPMYRFQVYQRA